MFLRLHIPALLLAVLSSGAAQAAPLYKVTRLSEAASSASVIDLNNAGQAIGRAGTGKYLWSGDGTTRFDDRFEPQDLNNHGVVVGFNFDHATSNYDGYKYQQGVYTALGALNLEKPLSSADAINDSGIIVGTSTYSDRFSLQPVRYDPSGPVPLNIRLEAANPRAINAAGTIAGTYHYEDPFNAIFVERSFLYHGGKLTSLPLQGNASVTALAINDRNIVAGYIAQYFGNWRPFLYANGVLTTLDVAGAFSVATGINNAGQVVGGFGDSSALGHAFLFDGGASHDLDTLLVPGTGLSIKSAGAINDLGQIGGQGCDTAGNCYAVLLSPVPEPQSWGMWLAGAGLVGWITRRRNSVGVPG